MKKDNLLLLGLLALALGACSSDKETHIPRSCPQVAYVRDLGRVADYGADVPGPSTLVSVAAMRKVDGSCQYIDPDEDDKISDGVDVVFDLTMAAQKGPRLGGDRMGFPFFISIVKPNGSILKKEIMTADFEFPSDGKYVEKTESLHVFLPLKRGEDAMDYRVLAGFQLTEAQYKDLQEKKEALDAEQHPSAE